MQVKNKKIGNLADKFFGGGFIIVTVLGTWWQLGFKAASIWLVCCLCFLAGHAVGSRNSQNDLDVARQIIAQVNEKEKKK